MKAAALVGERQKFINYLYKRICFDNLEGRGCDHQACYELQDIIHKVTIGIHLL